jgi:hypothetical protein
MQGGGSRQCVEGLHHLRDWGTRPRPSDESGQYLGFNPFDLLSLTYL